MSSPALESDVIAVLTPLLGVHTARRAFALAVKGLDLPRDATATDADAVCKQLTPMLRTLLGAEPTERVLRRIKRRTGATP
ncbi:MAG: hypothetical protein AAF721_23005 [Myxococcota bacterium]